jgi:hypothetical protein
VIRPGQVTHFLSIVYVSVYVSIYVVYNRYRGASILELRVSRFKINIQGKVKIIIQKKNRRKE